MSEAGEFDVAIVGLACRFPGAPDAAAFWSNLEAGVESIRRLSEADLRDAGVPEELFTRPDYVRAAPTLEAPADFDAEFFGYSTGEAAAIDPQQRLMLELAHAAFEDAGLDPERHPGRIAVFAGAALNTYQLDRGATANLATHYIPTLVAGDKDFLATRLSYKLGLRGPSLTVQTACSTSLVAVHLACQSLLSEECDAALAGAVSIRFPHRAGYLYDGSGVVSRDGRVKAFAADADGTVFGSGAGVVVLKRAADALAAGDRIYAVIKGSAVNNDGSAKAGYTAPSVGGQADAVAEALGNAGLSAEDLSYLEAHGSGTPLGDRIEVTALTQAFRRFTDRRGFCALGSVKTNVGHLDAAAGMAGLIKTALALHHERIPATLHCRVPHPEIDFAASPFVLAGAAQPWPRTGRPRRAGVMSTGMGGTNAHVILEEAPLALSEAPSGEPLLFVLSAQSEAALAAAAARLRAWTESEQAARTPPADAARTLGLGRRQLGWRRAASARSLSEAAQALDAGTIAGRVPAEGAPPVALLLPGAGEQYPGMGAGLYARFAAFREEIDRCAELLRPQLGCDLRTILYPPGTDRPAAARPALDLRQLLRRGDASAPPPERPIDRTLFCQAALFATEYALARLWMEFGAPPARLVGHSLGEWVAACVAGVFTLPDALRVIAERARLVESLPPAAMTAVLLAEEELVPLLSPELSVALLNGPSLSVVAGPAGDLARLHERLKARGAIYRSVRNGHPFHTARLEAIAGDLRRALRSVPLQPPRLPFLSGLTGDWITPAQATDPEYWIRQSCSTVRFSAGLQRLWDLPEHVLVEAGPGRTLGILAMQHPARGPRPPAHCASLRPEYEAADDVQVWLEAAARLWTRGVPVRLEAARPPRGRVAPLPTYAFQRRLCWLERPAASAAAAAPALDESFHVPQWDRCPPARRAPAPPAERPLWLDLGAPETGAIDRLDDRWPDGTARLAVRISPGRAGLEKLIGLAASLAERRRGRPVRLGVVTSGAHDVSGSEALDPAAALAVGAALVLPREFPAFEVFAIDADPSVRPDDIEAEFATAKSGDVIAWRGRQRWERSFRRVRLSRSGAPLRRNGVCVITGGTGGIGFALARALARDAAARLALVARRRPDPEWLAAARRQIEADGGEMDVWTADVGDGAALSRALDSIRARWGPIAGAIHAAGVRRDGMIELKTPADIAAILAPKVDGARHLLRALEGDAPDFVVLCSSLSSLAGYHGQVDYAAANAFLDSFAAWASRAFSCPVQAINWPVWRDVGMAAGTALAEGGLSTEDGVEAFRRVVQSRRIQVAVSLPDLAAVAEAAGRVGAPAPEPPRTAEDPGGTGAEGEVETAIAEIWREVLGNPGLGPHDDFIAAGGHSLLAMRIVSRIRAAYAIDFTLRRFFAAPTIAGNAAAVQEAILEEIDRLEPDHA